MGHHSAKEQKPQSPWPVVKVAQQASGGLQDQHPSAYKTVAKKPCIVGIGWCYRDSWGLFYEKWIDYFTQILWSSFDLYFYYLILADNIV